MSPRRSVLAALLLACSACVAGGETRGPSARLLPSASAPGPSAVAAGADLDFLLEQLETIHPEPFHGVTRAAFVARLDEIQRDMGGWSPEETMVAVMGLVAMLSREGQDGHQLAIPIQGGPMLPLRVFEFADGLFITDAQDESLVGTRITEIAGRPTDEVLGLLEPLVPRDSPATVPGLRPFFLLRADVLQGLGLIAGDATIDLRVEDAEGSRLVTLETISTVAYGAFAGNLGIIHLPERDGLRFTEGASLLATELLGGDTLYVHLREVQRVPLADIDGLRESLRDPAVTRVVFDLRHNPGGDNGTYPPLLAVLRDIEQPLWVLTDRRTFSAASQLATEIEQSTDARFAGEPMGGGVNFWDDVRFVDLERLPIPLSVGISTRYWQKSFADDPRLTIEPDLAVPYRSADYFAGVDATLEAVLSAP